ncbi:MAG TPA: SapC family protein [Pseudomonadales bacterium]|nr:SapC family protein [Pseudomonadales bacterium]
MKNLKILNNVEHKDLRVIQGQPQSFGDVVHSSPCYTFEFRNLQNDFPILLQESAEYGYLPVALMGFEKAENLFVQDDQWTSHYVPAFIRKGPFYIGTQKNASGDEMRLMSIDLDHPRVNLERGEALFQPLGGRTDYLEQIADLLETIYLNAEITEQFTAELKALNLIESVTFDIKLTNGSHNQLLGFYTIDEDRLKQLDGATLERLSAKGFLLPIFMMIASLSNITKMVKLKELKVAAA